MRLLILSYPHLPLRVELARASYPTDLLVLGGQPWEPGTVLDCSPAARRLGVRRGQPLGAAHKLVPEALFLAADRAAYSAAFEAALDALAAFAPAIEGDSDPESERFGQALVGIEGLHRLWGDEPTLLRRIAAALRPLLPGVPRAGIGNTRFGAQVAAYVANRELPLDAGDTRFGAQVAAVVGERQLRVAGGASVGAPEVAGGEVLRWDAIPAGDGAVEAAYLAPRPIRLLPADQELQARFALFGLTRIGAFAELPRSAVVARFGNAGGDLHDLASGLDGRRLVPRRPVERLRAEAELDPPAENLETLRFVLHHLTGALCEQLAARGAGAARARLTLELERHAPLELEQALPEPVALPALIERILVARLEACHDLAPVTRLILDLDGTAPAAGQQLSLFSPRSGNAARLEWQLTGLAIRFGADRLLRAELRDPEAPLAQDRFAWRPHGVEGAA